MENQQKQIEDLETRIAELETELSIWRSVFPDIAPVNVFPSIEAMLRDARDMALEEAAQCVDRATSGRAFFAGYSFEDFETVSSEIRALKGKQNG